MRRSQSARLTIATMAFSSSSAVLSRTASSTLVRGGAPIPRRMPRRKRIVHSWTTRRGMDAVGTQMAMLLGALCCNPIKYRAADPPTAASGPARSNPAHVALDHVGSSVHQRPRDRRCQWGRTRRKDSMGSRLSCALVRTPPCEAARARRWLGTLTRARMSPSCGAGALKRRLETAEETPECIRTTTPPLTVGKVVVVQQFLNSWWRCPGISALAFLDRSPLVAKADGAVEQHGLFRVDGEVAETLKLHHFARCGLGQGSLEFAALED